MQQQQKVRNLSCAGHLRRCCSSHHHPEHRRSPGYRLHSSFSRGCIFRCCIARRWDHSSYCNASTASGMCHRGSGRTAWWAVASRARCGQTRAPWGGPPAAALSSQPRWAQWNVPATEFSSQVASLVSIDLKMKRECVNKFAESANGFARRVCKQNIN